MVKINVKDVSSSFVARIGYSGVEFFISSWKRILTN